MTGLPKYLKFYVDNFSDIAAAIQLDQTSRKNLPDAVMKILEAAISKNIARWKMSEIDNASFAHHKDEYGVTWWHPSWMVESHKEKEDSGAYFGVFQLTEHALIDAVEVSERPFLYLYCHKKYRGLNKARLRAAIRRSRVNLQNLEFPSVIDEDDEYVVTQSLADVLSINALCDLEKMEREFLSRTKRFSEILAPIISKTASGT